MKKFAVVWSSGGYDGDDEYCFGSADIEGIVNTREEAVELAKKTAQDIMEEYLPKKPYLEDEEEYTQEEWDLIRNKSLDYEEELDADGNLSRILLTHYDEMFPHFGCIKISEIEI